MDKNTVLAIVLSLIVLIGGLLLQQRLFPPTDLIPQETGQAGQPGQTSLQTSPAGGEGLATARTYETVRAAESGETAEIQTEQIYTMETDLVRVRFTNRGGDIISYELLYHNDSMRDQLVQMADNISEVNRAFSLSLGDEGAPIVNEIFSVRQLDRYTIGFFRDYELKNPDGTAGSFTLAKQYAEANKVPEAVARDIVEAKSYRAQPQQAQQPDGNPYISELANEIATADPAGTNGLMNAFKANGALVDAVAKGAIGVAQAIDIQKAALPQFGQFTQTAQTAQPQRPQAPPVPRGGVGRTGVDISRMSDASFDKLLEALERGDAVTFT